MFKMLYNIYKKTSKEQTIKMCNNIEDYSVWYDIIKDYIKYDGENLRLFRYDDDLYAGFICNGKHSKYIILYTPNDTFTFYIDDLERGLYD